MTLRRAMESREGTRPTEDAIRLGLRAWAVERIDYDYKGEPRRPLTAIVFGTCRSDGLRRAQTPARLCEPSHDTTWRVAEITGGWDAEVVWPLERS